MKIVSATADSPNELKVSRRSLLMVGAGLLSGIVPLLAGCVPAEATSDKDKKAKKMTNGKPAPITVPAGKQIATLASGCFWCVEAIFQNLKGVEKVESGYSGGEVANPSYELVCTGTTDHAEACQITFDPHVISYDTLLHIFFTTHDPTTLNRQGADEGTQYRSAIFYHDDVQKATAEKVIKELNAEKLYSDPIVTEVAPYKNFYKAEAYHQNYFNTNGNQPYCRAVIAPKVLKFREKYKSYLKP